MMTYADIAKRSGIPTSTLWVWRSRGKMPEPTMNLRQPLWDEQTIEAWLEEIEQERVK